MSIELFPADTSAEAAIIQRDVLRRLPPARRMAMVFEMNEMLRAVMTAGVRQRHPDYCDEQVRLAVIRLWLGDKLFHQVYRNSDAQP